MPKAYQAAGTATQPARFVISERPPETEATAWIAAANPVEVFA